MNYIEKELINEIKNMDGSLLGIGITNEFILNEIANNEKISKCDLLNNQANTLKSKDNKQKLKTIRTSKFRKQFKKKKIDYIVVSNSEVEEYISRFIKDSIYITRKKVFFIIEDKEKIDSLIFKYKLYKVLGTKAECKDGYIIKFNIDKIKTSHIKDIKFDIITVLADIINTIGDFL